MAKKISIFKPKAIEREIFRAINKVQKNANNLVNPGMREAAKEAQAFGKKISPVVSGLYRKSIRRSTRSNVRAGFVISQVGISKGSPAIRYARMVENNHHIWTIVEKKQDKPVKLAVIAGINKQLMKWRDN